MGEINWLLLSVALGFCLGASVTGFQMCGHDEFRCVFLAKCLRASQVCDGQWDCVGGMDEDPAFCQKYRQNESCRPSEFRCTFGGCVTRDKVCDAYIDCFDTSDETETLCSNNRCPDDMFRCKYGACIPRWRVCSGVAECIDGSDETPEACANKTCATNQFQCAYGGCIDAVRVCDGRADCPDRSDERHELCDKNVPQSSAVTVVTVASTPRPTTTSTSSVAPPVTSLVTQSVAIMTSASPISSGCPLPSVPSFGDYVIKGCEENSFSHPACLKQPGSRLPVDALVEFTCASGYRLKGSPVVVCTSSGRWTDENVSCVRIQQERRPPSIDRRSFCPRLESRKGVVIKYNDQEKSDFSFPSENFYISGLLIGTEALYECAPYYVPSTNARQTYKRFCGQYGLWSGDDTFQCVPECGKSDRPITPYVANGKPTTLGQWPWHAGIYGRVSGRWQYHCGASLINENAVVTAAHCVTTSLDTSRRQHPLNIRVVLGKYYRDYYREEKHAQIREVRSIHIESNYNPASYDSDVAILVFHKPVDITHYVRPVCYLHVSTTVQEHTQITPGVKGVVVGWGQDESRHLSDELRMAELEVVSPQMCMDTLQVAFRSQVRSTTFCARGQNATNVCNGDSGSGMVIAGGTPNDKRWYLQGIVSVGVPTQDGASCDSSTVSFFTRVGKYSNWILRVLAQANSGLDVRSKNRFTPLIRVEVSIHCGTLNVTNGVSLRCVRAKTLEVSACEDPLPVDSGVRYGCLPYYKPTNRHLPTYFRKCGKDGTWTGDDKFGCTPECGKMPDSTPKTISQSGQIVQRGHWPWVAAIFLFENGEWSYRCGGTLVSSTSILTAAQCVTQFRTTEPVSVDRLAIAFGKYSSIFEEEDEHVVIADVDRIFIHPEFNSSTYGADLALVSLTYEVNMTRYIRPACIPEAVPTTWNVHQVLYAGNVGVIAGWGLSDTGNLTNIMHVAQIPVVPHHYCKGSYPSLEGNPRLFCAVVTKKTPRCNGDIGGGMVFPLSRNNPLDVEWHIYGVVSSGGPPDDESKRRVCNPKSHAVFVNVASFAMWLNKTLTDILDAHRSRLNEVDIRAGFREPMGDPF